MLVIVTDDRKLEMDLPRPVVSFVFFHCILLVALLRNFRQVLLVKFYFLVPIIVAFMIVPKLLIIWLFYSTKIEREVYNLS